MKSIDLRLTVNAARHPSYPQASPQRCRLKHELRIGFRPEVNAVIHPGRLELLPAHTLPIALHVFSFLRLRGCE